MNNFGSPVFDQLAPAGWPGRAAGRVSSSPVLKAKQLFLSPHSFFTDFFSLSVLYTLQRSLLTKNLLITKVTYFNRKGNISNLCDYKNKMYALKCVRSPFLPRILQN